MNNHFFVIPLRQALGKNMIYYGALFVAISVAFLFSIGMPPQAKVALIVECLFPLFASLIIVDTGLIDRYVGSWGIVLSSMNNPYLYLRMRFGSVIVLLLLFLVAVSTVSAVLLDNTEPVGLALSSVLNTLSLGLCGAGIAFLWKTSLISYVAVIGLTALSIQLAPMIPFSWQLFPHLFGSSFSAGMPLRVFQLFLIVIVPFLISRGLRHER